jgi:hypothetical protein
MQISFNSHEQLKWRGSPFLVQANEYEELPVPVLEEILRANTHIVENFAWVSASIQNYEGTHVNEVQVDDMGNHMTFR